MKDERVTVAYGRKIKSVTGVQYEMDNYYTAWEGTAEDGDIVGAIKALKRGELRAEVETQIAIDRQDARAAREGPVITKQELDDATSKREIKTTFEREGPPPDPAELPDAEVWYPPHMVGKVVSDLPVGGEFGIEWYLGSRIVIGAKPDDQRVLDFVAALDYWRAQRKGGT